MPIVGLCGAHRVGKTSLCEKVAELDDSYYFYKMGVSSMLRYFHYDPSKIQTMSIDEILDAQTLVFEYIKNRYEAYANCHDKVYIFDRTPLDALTYMQSAISGRLFYDSDSSELMNILDKYYNDCYELTMKCCDVLILIQPGVKPVSDPTKALADPMFQDHINTLLLGHFQKIQERADKTSPMLSVCNHEIITYEDRTKFVDEQIRLWFLNRNLLRGTYGLRPN